MASESRANRPPSSDVEAIAAKPKSKPKPVKDEGSTDDDLPAKKPTGRAAAKKKVYTVDSDDEEASDASDNFETRDDNEDDFEQSADELAPPPKPKAQPKPKAEPKKVIEKKAPPQKKPSAPASDTDSDGESLLTGLGSLVKGNKDKDKPAAKSNLSKDTKVNGESKSSKLNVPTLELDDDDFAEVDPQPQVVRKKKVIDEDGDSEMRDYDDDEPLVKPKPKKPVAKPAAKEQEKAPAKPKEPTSKAEKVKAAPKARVNGEKPKKVEKKEPAQSPAAKAYAKKLAKSKPVDDMDVDELLSSDADVAPRARAGRGAAKKSYKVEESDEDDGFDVQSEASEAFSLDSE